MRALVVSTVISLLSCRPAVAAEVFPRERDYFPITHSTATALLPDVYPENCFPVGQILFDYPITLARKSNLQVGDLSKLKSVADTVKAATPDAALVALAGQQLGQPHVFRFDRATITARGDAGLEWHVDYNLFPKEGGYSGIPFRYRVVLDGHGQVIRPRVSVYDAYAHSPEEGWTCSVLVLSPSPPKKDENLTPERIREIATAGLGNVNSAASRRMIYRIRTG